MVISRGGKQAQRRSVLHAWLTCAWWWVGLGPQSPDFSKPPKISALLRLLGVIMSPSLPTNPGLRGHSRARVPSELQWDGEQGSAGLWFLFGSSFPEAGGALLQVMDLKTHWAPKPLQRRGLGRQ